MLKTIRNYTYRTAFIVVDVQYDFLQDGALSITDANSVIPIINQTRAYLSSKVNALTVFTKDFHPVDHVSFQNNNIGSQLFETITLPNGVKQIIWPSHCVQGTIGSELHPHLYYKETDRVFLKGTKRDHDSYSGFGSPNMKDENTGLLNYLRSKWVSRVVIVGLATDHCVKATALHAIENGFQVYIILSACRGVSPDTTKISIREMTFKGIIVLDNLDELKMHI